MSSIDEITAELGRLRKGRGVNRPDIDHLLGPHLLQLTDGQGRIDRRTALVAMLNRLAARLAEVDRLAIMASLGLGPELQRRQLLKLRREWLMDTLQVAERTAQRRIEDAEKVLAADIARELERRAGGYVLAHEGWYLDRLKTLFCLTTASPEAYELRRIVATVDDLAAVKAWTNVPGTAEHPPPTVDGEVLAGGRLVSREPASSHCHEFLIELPKPLKAGEMHEYLLRLRLAPGQTMRPHYILTPEYRCDRFDLRVRFDPDKLPDWVRRVDGEPVRVFEQGRRRGEILTPDKVGEVHVSFDRPALLLGYGVQWSA